MHDPEKSDSGIVAAKPSNKAGRPVTKPAEPRPGTKGNEGQQSTHRAQHRARVTQALDGVRKAARLKKKERFTALLHHITVDTLQTAFYALRGKAAPGVDGMTWQDYEADLEPRLRELHERVHRGAYRPQPSRRTYIPKADGKQRPLAIAAQDDARRFLDAMRERIEAFALTLHSDKARLIEFGRYAATNLKTRGLGKPATFMFLGFIHICGKSRRGNFLLERKTRRDRLRTKLQDIKAELRRRMHQPIPVQGKWLRQVITGHFAYYAVPANGRALSAFRYYVTDLWRRTLRRRSQRDGFTWDRMTKLADDWLPQPRILHPWPQQRFRRHTHPR